MNKSEFSDKEIVEILVKLKYLKTEDAQSALSNAKIPPIEFLVSSKKLTKDLVGQAIAENFGLEYLDLNSSNISEENLLRISEKEARENRIICINQSGKKLRLTTDNVVNVDGIKKHLKLNYPDSNCEILYSLSEDIDLQLKRYIKPLSVRVQKIIKRNHNIAAEFFEEIMKDAYEKRASDIHIEPYEKMILIRFRIDGLLEEVAEFEKEYYENLLNRIKVLAGIRIDEHYKPLEGAIRYLINDVPIDLRISIISLVEGEKIAIRLLSNYIKNLDISDLGLTEKNFQIINEVCKKSYGMILTTGPTGSGKTTTLYSIIKKIQSPQINITTIEDPVEYKIYGINQIQVRPEHNITFASGLKTIVRQDPNVILVGEIRDIETAEIAVNASLTGHLLLSTFHATDAATVIPRLLDMEVEPFLLASTLSLIIAQRLLRKTCTNCKYSVDYTQSEIEKILGVNTKYLDKSNNYRFYKGKGCTQCNNSGFKGRIGIFELIYITERLQDLILKRPSSKEIWEIAQAEGSTSFFMDGIEKIKSGDVSIEELIRVARPSINSNSK